MRIHSLARTESARAGESIVHASAIISFHLSSKVLVPSLMIHIECHHVIVTVPCSHVFNITNASSFVNLLIDNFLIENSIP